MNSSQGTGGHQQDYVKEVDNIMEVKDIKVMVRSSHLMYATFNTINTFSNFYKTRDVILFCVETLLLIMEYKA